MEQQKTQQNIGNWLEEEKKELEQNNPVRDLRPALKLEENKVTEFEIISNVKWDKWIDPESKVIKKIIPIKHNSVEMVLFLNTSNPTYKILVNKAIAGQTKFKIIRIGQGKGTRFNLVE